MNKTTLALAIASISIMLFACNSSEKTIWVVDNEHVLTPEQISKLDSLYKSHERNTTNEIALVTTSDYSPDSNLFFFAVNFGEKHGVGKKEKNNGIVIVFNGVRHETMISTGYGTEKILTDEITKKIIDSLMIPEFKQGNTFEGIWQGSRAIVEFLEKPENKIN